MQDWGTPDIYGECPYPTKIASNANAQESFVEAVGTYPWGAFLGKIEILRMEPIYVDVAPNGQQSTPTYARMAVIAGFQSTRKEALRPGEATSFDWVIIGVLQRSELHGHWMDRIETNIEALQTEDPMEIESDTDLEADSENDEESYRQNQRQQIREARTRHVSFRIGSDAASSDSEQLNNEVFGDENWKRVSRDRDENLEVEITDEPMPQRQSESTVKIEADQDKKEEVNPPEENPAPPVEPAPVVQSPDGTPPEPKQAEPEKPSTPNAKIEDIPPSNGRYGWQPWHAWAKKFRMSPKFSKVMRHFIDRWNATEEFYKWQSEQRAVDNPFRDVPITTFINQMMKGEVVFQEDKHTRQRKKDSNERRLPPMHMDQALKILEQMMLDHKPPRHMKYTNPWDERFWIEIIHKQMGVKIRFSIINYNGPIRDENLDIFILNKYGKYELNLDALNRQYEYNQKNGNNTHLRCISGHSQDPDAPLASLREDPTVIPLKPEDTEILCFSTDEPGLAGILEEGKILIGGPSRGRAEIYFKDCDEEWGDKPKEDPWLKAEKYPNRNPNVWPVHYHSGKYSHMSFLVRTHYPSMHKQGIFGYKTQNNGITRAEKDTEIWPIMTELLWKNAAGKTPPIFWNWTKVDPSRIPDYAKAKPLYWGFNTPGFPACCIPSRVPTEYLGLSRRGVPRPDIPKTPQEKGNETPPAEQPEQAGKTRRRQHSREPPAKAKKPPPPLPTAPAPKQTEPSNNPALAASLSSIREPDRKDPEDTYVNMKEFEETGPDHRCYVKAFNLWKDIGVREDPIAVLEKLKTDPATYAQTAEKYAPKKLELPEAMNVWLNVERFCLGYRLKINIIHLQYYMGHRVLLFGYCQCEDKHRVLGVAKMIIESRNTPNPYSNAKSNCFCCYCGKPWQSQAKGCVDALTYFWIRINEAEKGKPPKEGEQVRLPGNNMYAIPFYQKV